VRICLTLTADYFPLLGASRSKSARCCFHSAALLAVRGRPSTEANPQEILERREPVTMVKAFIARNLKYRGA